MRIVFYLVLLLGLGLAGGAVYMANGYIGEYQAELARERATREQVVSTVAVLVAKEQLRYGDVITAESVREVRWPEDAVPEGAFLKVEDLLPQGDAVPRIALRAIEKDEALLAVKMTEPGQDAGVASRIGKGMRAFAISVDVSTGVSGFLRPGDRVDVYWTGRPPQQRGEGNTSVTKLIETGISLIAIDQIADGESSNPTIARTVTVEATPQQVASLAQAQSSGKLSLALVGVEDDSVVSGVETDQNTLLGIVAEEVAVAEPEVVAQVCTIRTRRGADIVETKIPCTN